MKNRYSKGVLRCVLLTGLLALMLGAGAISAQTFQDDFNRAGCTFTNVGSNPYHPLWPGYSLTLEGEEEDEGEILEIRVTRTVLTQTELVDGVVTRILQTMEYEDDELTEIANNFVAVCRETGDVWYFGEDSMEIDEGEVVGTGGSWRAGIGGARPGILMLGNPVVGARYQQEIAPGVAEDRGEVISHDPNQVISVPAGDFPGVLVINDTDPLDPGDPQPKTYAHGIGEVIDETLELTQITPPPCQPNGTTHCLSDGRFMVQAEWEDFQANEGVGNAILPSGDTGEFWFFGPDNTELIVKVLDACNLDGFNSFWVFAAGLTNVEVTLTVTDTQTSQTKTYENDLGTDFAPVLDTAAFATCP